MFIVDIEYRVDLSQVEPFMDEHLAFVKKYFEKGLFLVSGRKQPRTGGVIIVRNCSRQQLDDLLVEDPFYSERLAQFSITEFVAGNTAPAYESLREL